MSKLRNSAQTVASEAAPTIAFLLGALWSYPLTQQQLKKCLTLPKQVSPGDHSSEHTLIMIIMI